MGQGTDRVGQDSTGQDRTGQDWTGQDGEDRQTDRPCCTLVVWSLWWYSGRGLGVCLAPEIKKLYILLGPELKNIFIASSTVSGLRGCVDSLIWLIWLSLHHLFRSPWKPPGSPLEAPRSPGGTNSKQFGGLLFSS